MQLVSEVAREQTLLRVLDKARDRYDIILIDCAPSLGLLTVNALTASDKVIIPLECEFFALRGVALLTDTIGKVQDRLNPNLEILGILGTMYDARTLHSREVLERVVQAFGETVFHTVIRRTIKFPETTVAGEPITTYATTRPGPPPTGPWPERFSPGAPARKPPGRLGAVPGDPGPRGPSRTRPPFRASARRRTGDSCTAPSNAANEPAPERRSSRRSRPEAGRATGRVRHDEKITVYVSTDELMALEEARLALRRDHGIGVDRGRIVRAAIAMAVADLSERGDASALVERLRPT